jgi:hypothetical protein
LTIYAVNQGGDYILNLFLAVRLCYPIAQSLAEYPSIPNGVFRRGR